MRIPVAGSTVFVHTGGVPLRGERPAVLLLHGAAMDHCVWRFLSRALAHDGFDVMAPDLPGHGLSEGPPLPDVPAMAAWSASVLDALEVERAAVVGHSMGSLVALELAASRPERARKAVLVCTAARMTVHPELQAAADACDRHAVDLMVGWSHTGMARLGGHVQPGTWSRALSRRLYERNLAVLGTDLRACSVYPAADRATGITVPTLVVGATEDRMTPLAGSEAVAALVPGAQLEVVDGAGHMLHVDESEFLLRVVKEFLRRS